MNDTIPFFYQVHIQAMMHVEYRGFKLVLYSCDAISQDLKRNQPWEPHVCAFLNEYIEPHFCCVDLGANFGVHTLEMARLTMNKVYAFEPQPQNFALLLENVKNNGLQNVVTIPKAVGCNVEMVDIPMFDLHEDGRQNLGDVSVNLACHSAKTSVECCTLDSMPELNHVDFLKIDIQGYELFALQGMTHILRRCSPTMIVEFEDHQLDKYNYDAATIFHYLQDLEYHIFLLEYQYQSDHVCVHESKLQAFTEKFGARIVERYGINPVCPSISALVTQKLVLG